MSPLRPQGRAPRVQGIRFRLGLAMGLALLPILLLGVLQANAAFHRDDEVRRTELLLAAQRAAATAKARLDSAVVVLETLRPESMGLACSPRLDGLTRRLEGYDALVRYTASGRPACASAGVAGGIVSVGDADWFGRLQAGAPLVVERAPGGQFGRRPELLAAVRAVDAAGRFDGAFVAVLPLAGLAPATAGRALPEGAEVALADAGGDVLIATDRAVFPAGPAWGERRPQGASAQFRGEDQQGRRRVFAAAPLVGEEVYVLLSAPRPGLFSWARLNALSVVILPLLAWLLALGAVLVVSERIVIRWLSYLERIASIYAKGRFSVRPVQARNAPAEIRALANTLDEMGGAIDARDLSLHESLAEKDALMREIHHRVKNNLQVISSLLNMQQRALTDPAARAAMNDTRQRIGALALIYRALYQSEDIRRVDVRVFLEELIAQLISGESGRGPLVKTELEADALVIDPDKLAPLALWAVEAISNAQKHAFDGRGGVLKVRFRVENAESRLDVEDDGPGVADDSAAGGVGRTLMTAFARQLRGRAEIGPGPDGGVLARLIFPTPEAMDPPRAAGALKRVPAAEPPTAPSV